METPLDIPDMGSHIMIDFLGVQDFDLHNPAQMIVLLEEALKQTDCTLCAKTQAVHEKGKGYSLLFLLSESHLSVHTWPAKNAFTIDFYNCGKHSWHNLRTVEKYLCDHFGWEKATSSILLPRGRGMRTLNLSDHDSLLVAELRNIKKEKVKDSVIRQHHSEIPEAALEETLLNTGIS